MPRVCYTGPKSWTVSDLRSVTLLIRIRTACNGIEPMDRSSLEIDVGDTDASI